MGIVRGVRRKISVFIGLFVLLIFLAACGSAGTTTGSQPQPTSAATPTATQGYGTVNGCPNNTVVTSLPSRAQVAVTGEKFNATVNAHPGQVIEIRLPFGHKWTGPTSSQGKLELQQPAGFAWKADKVCIWRFVAKGTGTTNLMFHSQALCKPGEVCPMFITNVPITVKVK
jgi:hypothetical protein